MAQMKIHWKRKALTKYKSIILWYKKKMGTSAAGKFMQGINDVVAVLEQNPYMGKEEPGLTRYFLGVVLLHFPYNAYICLMTDPTLLSLAQIVLPCEVLESFDIVKVESNETEIHIHLDEKLYETLRKDVHFESKGFIPAVSITDFPIRDHKVILLFRRRKWIDTRTGKSFILPLKIAAEGTRYSQEFASFLKETYGHIPGDLPYT